MGAVHCFVTVKEKEDKQNEVTNKLVRREWWRYTTAIHSHNAGVDLLTSSNILLLLTVVTVAGCDAMILLKSHFYVVQAYA